MRPLFLAALLSLNPKAASAENLPLMDSLPNYKQPKYSMDCAPVAAANSLLWLQQQGYAGLVERRSSQEETAQGLIDALASFMKTRQMRGTFAKRFLTGLEKYVQSRGYRIKRLEYRGRAPHPRRFGPGSAAPSADWLKAGLSRRSVVWIGIGRYRSGPNPEDLQRTSGHWASLVGADIDASGNPSPGTLVIRNPSPKTAAFNQALGTFPLGSGRLLGRKAEPPVDGAGFLRVVSGFDLGRKAIAAVVDSGIILELEEPKEAPL